MCYQEINELLAKGVKKENMSADSALEVDKANEYLLNQKGEKPGWIDGFLDSNRCKLVETICRATSMPDGISSLQGYSEGYFNEIVQNANDLHSSSRIDIDVNKNGDICAVICKYADAGFELSNIYAFLNREMSDKTGEKNQTGKFGVGIKSFFKFVNRMSIKSNVLFDFSVIRKSNDVEVSGITEINKSWNCKFTELFFSYNSDYQSGFNVSKLTDLICFLEGEKQLDIKKSFIDGEDRELVFDIRSLLFMKANSKNKKCISQISFSGTIHNVDIKCDEVQQFNYFVDDSQKWNVGILKLTMLLDEDSVYEKEYILFVEDKMSFAFPLETNEASYNRMYATYYLKQDFQKKILPLGMLVDSSYANMYRNDVGNSEDEINKVYQMIREQMMKLYSCMCSEEIAKLECNEKVSDIFHFLLSRYICVNIEEYWESPLKCQYCSNEYLKKIKNEETKKYTVFHKKEEEYDTTSYREGNIVQELREEYFEYVEKKEVYDFEELVTHQDCIKGVRQLYSMLLEPDNNMILEQNRKIVCEMINYYDSVGEFLVYRISGERRSEVRVTDAEIDNWLIGLRSIIGRFFKPVMFLKLVGRYKLNAAVAYDGSVKHANLSFKDYLFNGILESEEGILAKEQNKKFDEMYFNLKQELLKKRYVDTGNTTNQYNIRCIRPIGRSVAGWDGSYDYDVMHSSREMNIELLQPVLLLEKMAMDEKFTELHLNFSTLKLFEKKARSMRRREYCFKNSIVIEQQIIDLSCLKKIVLGSFSEFIKAIKYRSLLSDDISEYISVICKQEEITTINIVNELLPVMVEVPEEGNNSYILDEFSPDDVYIEKIEENSNDEMPKENSEFIFKATGYKVHLYHFDSNSRRKMMAYFGNGVCSIKTEASKAFREVAKYNAMDENIYVFYDNFSGGLQDLVTVILNEIGVGAEKIELLSGYIHNGNNLKAMNYVSRRRNLAKVHKKLLLDWAEVEEGDVKTIYNNEILYRLLTARGSYDIFCPICADIPLEIFEYGEERKKKHSRKIIVLENENPDTNQEFPYIITVACSYCCEKLKSILSKSEFDGKNIILTTQVAHGLHEKMKSKQQIELSPVNIEVMKKFKI